MAHKSIWRMASVALLTLGLFTTPPAIARAAIGEGVKSECGVIGHASAFRQKDGLYSRDLKQAADRHEWSVVRGLVLLGAKSPRGMTKAQMRALRRERVSAALIPASAAGDARTVLRLLKAGADANAVAKADNYMSPLIWAARCEHPAVVEVLIEHGARVDERAGYSSGSAWIDGTTALIQASDSGASQSVSVLLKHHANRNLRESWLPSPTAKPVAGRSAIELADDPRIREMLLSAAPN